MKIDNLKDNRKASERFDELVRKDIREVLPDKEKKELFELANAIDKFETTFLNLD